MPRDSVAFQDLLADDLSFVPGREGLRRLAKLLRLHVARIPHTGLENFIWNYGVAYAVRPDCRTFGCAWGIGRAVWGDEFVEAGINPLNPKQSIIQHAAIAFQIPVLVAGDIFASLVAYNAVAVCEVTPEMVADKIDDYLANGSPYDSIETMSYAKIEAQIRHDFETSGHSSLIAAVDRPR